MSVADTAAYRDRSASWVGPLFVVLSLATLLSIAVAAFLPVYTDELAWKMVQGRFDFDGGETLRLNPTCGPLGTPVPLVLLPFRRLDALLFESIASPLPLRITGVVLAAAWLALTCWLLSLRPGASDKRLAPMLALSCATIGVMPLLLVINRPEQIMLIGLTILVLPILLDLKLAPGPMARDLALGVVVLAAGGVLLSCHALAALLWPLLVLFLPSIISRRILSWPIAAILAYIAFATVKDFGVRGVCVDPKLQSLFLQDNILAAAGMGQLGKFLLALVVYSLFYPAMALLVGQFQFKQAYISDMIPPVHDIFPLALGAGLRLACIPVLLATLLIYLQSLRQALSAHKVGRAMLAVGFLWAFWAFCVVDRVRKSDYEAELLMPVLAMAAAGSVWLARERFGKKFGQASWGILTRRVILGMAGLSIVSQVCLLVTYLPLAYTDWQVPGYARGQRFSVTTAGYDSLRREVEATGAMCGIFPANHPRHIVLDELTYYAYRTSYQPILATYIDRNGWGRNLGDIAAILTSLGSEGLVTGCQWVPSELNALARHNGAFCCVPSLAGHRAG